MSKLLELNSIMQVSNGAHILYVFDDLNDYISNLLEYINTGIKCGHHILIIENTIIIKEIEKRIGNVFSGQKRKKIHFLDNHLFYGYYGDFHMYPAFPRICNDES